MDPSIDFILRHRNLSAYFGQDGALLSAVSRIRGVALRHRFVEGRSVRPRGGRTLSTRVSSFVGDSPQWTRGDAAYAEILYDEVWPGIDVVFEPRGRNLEYTLRVRPGADVRQARFRYEGAERIRGTPEGGLLVDVAGGTLQESAPLAFQETPSGRRTVDVRVDVGADGSYGFEVAGADPARELVIDPIVDYSTLLGSGNGGWGFSGGSDVPRAVTTDAAGNIVVTGHTESDFPTTVGAYMRTRAGFTDVFVCKLNPAGTALIWSTLIGGYQGQGARGVALDAAGDVYLAGTAVDGFPTTPGAFQTSGGGSFACKLSADGSSLLWSTMIGNWSATCMALDGAGNVYVGGRASSSATATAGAYDPTHNGFDDGFVVKVNAGGGSLGWATFLGGAQTDWLEALAIDAGGHVFVGGWTESSGFPTTPGVVRPTYGSPYSDAFVTKINPDGASLAWSTLLGGDSSDYLQALALMPGGEVALSVHSASGNYPITPGAYAAPPLGAIGKFVTVLSSTASSISWSTFIGKASFQEFSPSIVADASGNVYITGSTSESTFPTTPGTHSPGYNGDGDAFVTKVLAGGTALGWSTFIGGNSSESGVALCLAADGGPIVVGTTHSQNFPASPGAYDRVYGGTYDGFVVRLTLSGGLGWATYLGAGSGQDFGKSFATDAAGRVYVTGVTEGTEFPTTVGAYDRTFNSHPLTHFEHQDAFVACLSADGSVWEWCTYLGGSANEISHAIALDPAGNVRVAGWTLSPNFPTTPGCYQAARPGGMDGFVSSLSSDGSTLLWSTYLGGTGSNIVRCMNIDVAGKTYLFGEGDSTFPTTPGAYSTTCNGAYDFFAACLSADGSTLEWSTFLGGPGIETPWAMALDASGNVFIAGSTDAPSFPVTPGCFDPTYGGGRDSVVAKILSGGGALGWATYAGGGNGNDEIMGLALDGLGGVVIVGPAVPLTRLSPDGSSATWSNGLVRGMGLALDAAGIYFMDSGGTSLIKVDPSGAPRQWIMRMETPSNSHRFNAMGFDAQGRLVLVGEAYHSSFPTTPGSADPGYNGANDVAVVRINALPGPLTVNDGPGADIDIQTSNTTLNANWSGFLPGATSFRVTTSVSLPTTVAGTATSVSIPVFPAIPSGTTVLIGVTGFYEAGLGFSFVSDGVLIESQGPMMFGAPVGAPTPTADAFDVTWTAGSDSSGVASYEVERSFNGGAFATAATNVAGLTLSQSGLAAGNYVYRVRGVDTLGNVGSFTPDSNTVVVDRDAPQTTLNSGPSNPSGSASAAFDFSSSEAGSTFEVQLDGGGWQANGAVTTKSYSSLALGVHTFEVRAVDAAGHVDPTPASFTWTVLTIVADGQAPFQNGFDGPLRLSNWTLTASAPSVAWAVDATPGLQPAPGGPLLTGTFSLNYNDGVDYDSGGMNSGTATSPVVSLAGVAAPTLKFWCNHQTDTVGVATDRRRVQISDDGFSTFKLDEVLSVTPGATLLGPCAASGIWHEHVFPLDPAWGPVAVRVHFDTVTAAANGLAGWFLDDFEVSDLLVSGTEQMAPGSTVSLPVGGSVSGAAILIRSRISLAATGTVEMEVEVQPLGTPFTGTPSGTTSGTGAGSLLSVQMTLPAAGGYHWRLRTRNGIGGAPSQWMSFGTNSEAEADFRDERSTGGGGGGGGCGGLGLEFLPIAGLALLLRRLRRRS